MESNWRQKLNDASSEHEEMIVAKQKSYIVTLNDMVYAMRRDNSKLRWDDMKALLEKDPRAATVCELGGSLPLHQALTLEEPKLSTIRALVAAYPPALSLLPHSEGMLHKELPLHTVSGTDHVDIALFRFILNANKEAIHGQDEEGLLPIHSACGDGGNVAAVWELLSLDPESASEVDNHGRCPLDCLIWGRGRLESAPNEYVDLAELAREILRGQELENDNLRARFAGKAKITENIRVWAVAQLLLMARHHGSMPPLPSVFEDLKFITVDSYGIPGKFRVLHASLATGAYQELIQMCLTLYPEQLKEADEEYGRMALHWACQSGQHRLFYCYPCCGFRTGTTWYQYTEDERDTLCTNCYEAGLCYAVNCGLDETVHIDYGDYSVPCTEMLDYHQTSCETVVERIVSAYPTAASVFDKHGRLPLHHLVAADNYHNDSVLAVWGAWPLALSVRDPESNLLPLETVIF